MMPAIRSNMAIHSRAVFRRQWRALSETKLNATNPLIIWQQECISKNLCDESGVRSSKAHWSFTLSFGTNPGYAPSVKTVGIQRLSAEGIDFVSSQSSHKLLQSGTPVSFLYTSGQMIPGEKVTQWRGHGICKPLEVKEILDVTPSYTIAGIIGAQRCEVEMKKSNLRNSLLFNKSHLTDIVQTVRRELESGSIPDEEIATSVNGIRLVPEFVDHLVGGNDTVVWDRSVWELGTNGRWHVPIATLPWSAQS